MVQGIVVFSKMETQPEPHCKGADLKPALYLCHDTAFSGERISIHAFGDGAASARLVRLRGLIGSGLPTGYVESAVGQPLRFTASRREVRAGSAATSSEGPSVRAETTWRWTLRVLPTLPTANAEVLTWGHNGPRLSQRGKQLVVAWRGAQVSLPLDIDGWTSVTLEYSGGALRLTTVPVGDGRWWRSRTERSALTSSEAIAGPLSLGRGFNGKLEDPALEVDGRPLASWILSDAMSSQFVPGRGAEARQLALENVPRRAVRSSRWDGTEHRWTARPEHYSAIHFHADDLVDCAWPADAQIQLPAELASGIYAVRLDTATGTRHAPVFVRSAGPHELMFLASTFSYLAYGNSVWDAPSQCAARHPEEAALASSFGKSTYCRHPDGSGIGLVSSRRPLLNLTPGFLGEAIGGQVLLNDDLRVIAWMERLGQPYGVLTDHVLHHEGDAALRGCRVLVTGTHPEYHSRESLAALQAFVARGGRVLYMGGNGFYWRVSPLPDAPHVMEVRRAEGGVRKWAEAPGEYFHQADGELGGLWRRLGQPPNKVVGVGFSAQGFEDDTRPFERTAASHDQRVDFLLEGVSHHFGRPGPLGAAAGYELDRFDPKLGSPPHALVVARSLPFGPRTTQVNEELLTPDLCNQEDAVRADITFFEGPNGGAALACSSILFANSLEEDDGGGRLASNALRRFLDPLPFSLPAGAESNLEESAGGSAAVPPSVDNHG